MSEVRSKNGTRIDRRGRGQSGDRPPYAPAREVNICSRAETAAAR
jgi:hypothetical protein